jgi:hypothetical protein
MGVNKNAPSWKVPIVDIASGLLTQSWHGYLTGLAGTPGPILPVSPSGSPFAYKAPANGALAISGGTVSAVTLARARVAGVPLGVTSGCVSVSEDDVVTVTYSAAPTLNFIPT